MTAFFRKLSFLLFGLLLLADESGDELDNLVLLATRQVGSSVSTTEYTAFDILGRVKAHKQTTDGTAYTAGYNYYLDGSLRDETYPSGRVTTSVLDTTGDLVAVASKMAGAPQVWSYAEDFTYNAAGAVTSMQLGNGLWESTTFNSRLQPEQIALGATQNGTDKLKLNYTYSGATANNGNILSQTITVPGMASTLVQNYTYDELNRLKTATETSNVYRLISFITASISSRAGQRSPPIPTAKDRRRPRSIHQPEPPGKAKGVSVLSA